MTTTERDRIIGFLTGRGWVRLVDMRAQIRWKSTSPELLACINKLARRGVLVTTKPGELGFRVCLASEVSSIQESAT